MLPPPDPADLPDYATCERCGESYARCLRLVQDQEKGQEVLCENCRDIRHPRRRCFCCWAILACERHHVASERQQPTLIITVCLNCHRILSDRQYCWHPAWKTERHPLRYTVQGVLDVVLVWLDRSPAAEPCRALLTMLGQAALVVLAYLRLDALRDLSDLQGWEGI